MSLDDIWLFDPFDPTQDLTELVNYETYTVRKYTKLGGSWYGIQLTSTPAYKELTSAVSPDATRRIRIVKDDDPGYDYSEVSFTTPPSTNQFRADYDNRNPADNTTLANYKTTGLIEFNSTEEGQLVRVSYWGTGPAVLTVNMPIFLAGQTVPGTLTISGAFAVADDATLSANKDLKLSGTGRHEHGGVPVAGYCDDGTPFYRKIVEIGDWNMDADISPAPILFTGNIRSVVEVLIRTDDDTARTSLFVTVAGVGGMYYIGPGSGIILLRESGGYYDSTTFDATSYNRGWITIDYVD